MAKIVQRCCLHPRNASAVTKVPKIQRHIAIQKYFLRVS
jgi:hypothetical protein